MEENNNLPQLSPSDVQKLKMNPPENAWNRLDAELSRKQALLSEKKANRFKLLFILTGLLLLCSVTYFFFAPSRVKTIAATETRKAIPVNSNNTITTTTPSTITNTEVKKEVVSNTNPINTKPVNNTANNFTSPENTVTKKQNQLTNSETPQKPSTHLVKKQDTKNNSAKITPGTMANPKPVFNQPAVSNTVGKTDITAVTQPSSGSIASPAENKPAVSNTGNKADITAITQSSSNTVTAPVENQPASTGDKNNTTELAPATNTTVAAAPIATTQSVDTTIKTAEQAAGTSALNKPVESNQLNNAGVDKPKSKNFLSRLSIAAVFSPNHSKNHLTETDQSKVSASEYSNREKTNFTYTTGLLARVDLNSKWSVLTGATYSIMSYSITLPTIYAYTNSNNQLVYMYPTSCGLVELPNAGPVTATYNGESLNTPASCTQVVKFINVPLMLRYQVPMGRFIGYINAGAEINFVIQERSDISINNDNTSIVNNIDGLKKRNYGYVGGAGVQYNVLNGLGVFGELQYRGSINSLTQNTIVNCYPHSVGLNMGVAVHF